MWATCDDEALFQFDSWDDSSFKCYEMEPSTCPLHLLPPIVSKPIHSFFAGESSSSKAENETQFLVDTATSTSTHTTINDDGVRCNDAYIHGGEMKNWNELDFGCSTDENGSIFQN